MCHNCDLLVRGLVLWHKTNIDVTNPIYVKAWTALRLAFPCTDATVLREFSGTWVRHSTRTVGPRSDPYSESTLRVGRWGYTFTLISCGLRGCQFEMEGQVVVPFTEGRQAERLFTLATGARPDQFEHWSTRDYVEDPMGCLSDYL
jgi:hypothetical protein